MKRFVLAAVVLIAAASAECRAQRLSLSTNILEWASLGTMNMEGTYSISRRLSITAGARYNPFTFRRKTPEKQFQMRQQSYSLGVRMWPWHTGSGWWFSGKGRYQEYNFGGLRSRQTREGDRMGLGLCAGYTHMLSSHINLEFGLGFWGGLDIYKLYSCQMCGLTLDSGRKAFILPDDLMISLAYVF